MAYCRSCWNAYQSEYRKRRYATEPEYRAKIKDELRLRKYGVSADEYRELLDAQKGVCAICGTARDKRHKLGVDHDHKTGEVRGLLCLACNRGLGMFRDDPALLRAALDYLSQH